MQCTDAPPPLGDEVRAGLPKGIEKLLFELLQKDPDERPQSASAVIERLELFLPDKSFEGLGGIGSGPSSRKREEDTSAGSQRTKNDTLPSARSGSGSRRARDQRGESEAGERHERKDTVALIDEVAGERELSTGLSVLIIVALMLVSGVATYLWRASQSASETDATSETGSAAETD